MAQSTQPETSNKLQGTWFAALLGSFDGKETKRSPLIIWRIHKVDNSKNQIELTEAGERFENAKDINNPKRMKYKGHADGDSLFIELNSHVSKGKFIVKLKLESEEENIVLKGSIQKTDGNNDSLLFYLTKVSDDTSTYIKPIKAAQVIVMPPPPPKN